MFTLHPKTTMNDDRAIAGKRRGFTSVACASIVTVIAAAATTLPAAAQPGLTFTLPRGATTPITLSAPPNARCLLDTVSPRGGRSLTAFSNARGAVRYFVTMRPDARVGSLVTVECRNAAAHTLSGVTLIPGRRSFEKPRIAQRQPSIADLQTTAVFGVLPGTPGGFDVTRASGADLARLGYPARPDPGSHPSAYILWRKLVTTPGAYVAPGTVVNPEVRGPARHVQVRSTRRTTAGATIAWTTSNNWSGDVVSGQPAAFNEVKGQWIVPSVSTNGNLGYGYSCTWVGIDGWGNNDLVQNGTEQNVNSGQGLPEQIESYYAWYEFLPDYQHAMSNVSISSGDSVFAVSTVGPDATGTLNGYYYLYDYTTGQGSSANEAIPAGASFSGASAEWIVERTMENGNLGPMPDYTYAAIGSPTAITTDGNAYSADGSNTYGAADTQSNITMTSDGSPNTDALSQGFYNPNGAFGFAAGTVDFIWWNWL